MAKKSSIHLPKSYRVLLLALVVAWVLSSFSLLPLPAYPVAIVLTLLVALFWK